MVPSCRARRPDLSKPDPLLDRPAPTTTDFHAAHARTLQPLDDAVKAASDRGVERGIDPSDIDDSTF